LYRLHSNFGYCRKIDNRFLLNKFIVKSLDNARITAKEIETGRLLLRKFGKKLHKYQTRIFPFAPLTKRALGVRMGKGKGMRIHKYIYPCKINKILFMQYWALPKMKLRFEFFNYKIN